MEVDEKNVTEEGGESQELKDTVMKHNLPQIPLAVSANPRMAVSKASAKERSSPSKQFANIVSTEDMNKATATITPVKSDQPQPPSSMPTPPSDGTPSEHSPKSGGDKVEAASKDGATNAVLTSANTGTPLNQAIQGEDLVSPESADKQKKTPRAKTKGDIKKQLMKKKGQKGDIEKKDEGDSLIISETPNKDTSNSPQPDVSGQFMLGDMFFGKVGGHPWWPCMIAYDPFNTIFVRTLAKDRKQYHVQFFGQEGERGWVSSTRLEPYKGKKEHLQWLAEMCRKKKSKKKEFQILPNRRAAWDIACEESEEAYKVGRNERRAKFTLSYSPLKKKDVPTPVKLSVKSGTTKKGKRKLSLDTDKKNKVSPPKKKRKRTSSSSLSPSSKDSEKLSNQKLTQFTVFCSKKRDSVRRDHPTYSDTQIEKFLKGQWDEMGEDQKSKFIPMGSDVKNVSTLMPEGHSQESSGAKRMPKPSKKKMESEESASTGVTKRRKSSLGQVFQRRSSSLQDGGTVENIIDSVAAGAGKIPSLAAMEFQDDASDLVIDETPGALHHQKKKMKKDHHLDTDDSGSVSSGREDNGGRSKSSKNRGVELEDGEMFEPEIYKLSANPTLKKENICSLCEEQPGEMLQCDGPCCGTFHVSCLGLKKSPDTGLFKCDECTTGTHTCFVCKNTSKELKRCSVNGCGKFYHVDCIKKFNLTRIENGNLTCPLHTCATCAAENSKDPKASKGRLYHCVRCPTAYHAGDLCIAAGSMNLAGQHIVCSRHFQPSKTTSYHSHVNVSWCFLCSKGGALLCCETCPASFHLECLKIDAPEGAWYCRDCASGKKPLYGDIIWVKIGVYRWWPGEVCHPRNVPTNIQEKPHQVGEFPVRFFGSRDYFWMHQARVFLFQEGDKGCKESVNTKSLTIVFQKAQKEGALAYKMWREYQERREEKQQEINQRKPAPYKHIKTNQPVGNVTIYKADPAEIPRCECHPAMDNPCGDYSDCINRMTLEECHPAVCPAGEKCQNQRFQKREYPEVVPFKSSGKGWGLKALVDFKRGQFVNEYVGELVDEVEAKKRFKQAEIDNITNFYMLTLDTKRIIDAGPKGNLSRFMNHSCAPNCVTQKWTVNGDVRIGLFANQDVSAGSELTFNYNLDCLGNEKRECACGASTCSGYLGVKAKKEEPLEKPKLKKKKKKLKKHPQKVAEDECYRCGDGGELVVCDKRTCTKVYHLKCLKLAKLPFGKWLCPWHHCDDCGKPSIKLCSECPNSFCNLHIEGNIFLLPDNKLVCSDHDDILEAVEASKLENEPHGKLAISSTSSEATSTCSSSPAHSDSEVSASEIDNNKVLTETATEFNKSNNDDDNNTESSSGNNKGNGEGSSTPASSRKKSVKAKRKSTKKGGNDNVSEDIMESTSGEMLSPKQQADNNDGESSSNRDTLSNGNNDDTLTSSDVKSPNSEGGKKRASKGSGRKSSSAATPSSSSGKSNNSKSTTKQIGSSKKSESVVAAPQMFDDNDSDEPNLVIDIP